jgi:hypothetical protein
MQIRISLEGKEVICSPDPAVARPGDRVDWVSQDGDHWGNFADPEVLNKSGWSRSNNGRSETLSVRKDAKPGDYKYSVTLVTERTTHTVDPVLRVLAVDPMEEETHI